MKFEGKNVQLLGDMMLNNCGPGGSPPNSATMAGEMQPPLIAQAMEHDCLAEVQEICDIKCDCQASGQGQRCIENELKARDAASGYTRTTKAEVPYRMDGDPQPIMSNNEPWRQTNYWFHRGSRRPDAIVVRDPAQPWAGDNIKAVIECKLGNDSWNEGQADAYAEIAGSEDNVIEVNDQNCKCKDDDDDDERRDPVPISRSPYQSKDQDINKDDNNKIIPFPKPEPQKIPDDIAAMVGLGLLVGVVAVALVASAPVTATAAAAVAVFGLFAVSSDESGPGPGGA